MPDTPASTTRDRHVWLPLGAAMAVALGVGVYLGLNYSQHPTINFWIELAVGASMVFVGFMSLIDSRHFQERAVGQRLFALVMIVYGVSIALPRGNVRLALMGAAAVLFVVALFVRRSMAAKSS